MRVRRTLLVLTLTLLLGVGGLAVGSNMGFKYAPAIPASEANVDHWISLPYTSEYQNAQDICGFVPNASLISRFNTASGSRTDWQALR